MHETAMSLLSGENNSGADALRWNVRIEDSMVIEAKMATGPKVRVRRRKWIRYGMACSGATRRVGYLTFPLLRDGKEKVCGED